jgi:hypothetical protein
MAQESHRGFNKRRLKSGGISIGGSRKKSISGGQHCPYLSALDRDLPYNHPSSRNICRGQTTKKRRGFKTITIGYHKIDRDTQLEVCLPSFGECRYYQEKQKEPIKPAQTTAGTVKPDKGKVTAKTQKKPERRKHRRKMSALDSAKWHTAKQLGAISAVTIVIAFVVSFFLAGGPGKLIENLTFMYISNQAQELGLNKSDLDKIKAAGLLKGGGISGAKNLSRSQKEKLKKSSLFKGLSAEKKAKLRKRFGGK